MKTQNQLKEVLKVFENLLICLKYKLLKDFSFENDRKTHADFGVQYAIKNF